MEQGIYNGFMGISGKLIILVVIFTVQTGGLNTSERKSGIFMDSDSTIFRVAYLKKISIPPLRDQYVKAMFFCNGVHSEVDFGKSFLERYSERIYNTLFPPEKNQIQEVLRASDSNTVLLRYCRVL